MTVAPTPPADAALGTIERIEGDWRLRFVRDYPHPVEDVWAAITEPERTRTWWAEARIDPVLGGRFDLRWLNTPEAGEWWPGAITAWEPPFLLEHTNSEHGLLRWELQDRDGGTRLVFSDAIQPLEDRFVAMSLAGWHLHLAHLGEALDGKAQDWDTWLADWLPTWQDLHAAYAREYSLD